MAISFSLSEPKLKENFNREFYLIGVFDNKKMSGFIRREEWPVDHEPIFKLYKSENISEDIKFFKGIGTLNSYEEAEKLLDELKKYIEADNKIHRVDFKKSIFKIVKINFNSEIL